MHNGRGRHLLTPTELQPLQTEEHAALPDEVHLLQPNNVLRVGAGGVHTFSFSDRITNRMRST